MLLPNNILPKDSLFYNGGLILNILNKNKEIDFFTLFNEVNTKYEMTMSIFIFSLDWLYLCEAAIVDNNNKVSLCI